MSPKTTLATFSTDLDGSTMIEPEYLCIDPERLDTIKSISYAAWTLHEWRTPRPPETVDDITSRLQFEIAMTRQAYHSALCRMEQHKANYPEVADLTDQQETQ